MFPLLKTLIFPVLSPLLDLSRSLSREKRPARAELGARPGVRERSVLQSPRFVFLVPLTKGDEARRAGGGVLAQSSEPQTFRPFSVGSGKNPSATVSNSVDFQLHPHI